MKKFLEYVVSKIIDKDQKFEIEEAKNEYGEILFNIKVDASQIGQVVGRNGNIISAIRNLAKIIAVKQNVRARVNLVD